MAARIQVSRVVPAVQADSPMPGRNRTLTLLLAASLAGGIASPLLGLVLSIVHSLVPGDRIFERAAMLFTFVSIPLLLAGAHLMDVIDSRRKS